MSQSGNRERLSGDVEFQEATPAFSLQSSESGSRAKFACVIMWTKYPLPRNACQLHTSFDESAFNDNL